MASHGGWEAMSTAAAGLIFSCVLLQHVSQEVLCTIVVPASQSWSVTVTETSWLKQLD